MRPFEDGHVLCQVLFMDTPKRAEKIAQPCPIAFHRIAVYFAHAIAIIVARIFPLRMAHRVMKTPGLTQMAVGRRLVCVDRRRPACGTFHFGLNRLLLRILTHG